VRTTTTNRNTGTAKLEIVYRDIDSITPYKNNPRKNDEAAEELAEDIKKYDFNQPITIDADSIIVSGHTRYKAAKALGIKEVPTITLSHLTPRQIREYRIRDNKVGERADWDYEILTIECQEMGIDPADLGFDFDPGDIIDTTEVTEDDYEEPDELPPTVKLGEIWRCGDHILLCGDATDEATVRRLVQEGGGHDC
jgi:site-specific DNA-methyltransferase (adenine-specific)